MSSRYLYWWIDRSLARRDNEGFTLLEILIVTIVIGILASLAFPAYQRWIDKTRYAHARVQMNCMAKDLQTFKLENGRFPADVSRNIAPEGVPCFYRTNSAQVPFDSAYDYENWTTSGGSYLQITFLGKNRHKDYPNGQILFPTPGFYDYDDDLILSMGIN
jgi:type II secretion system protein G